MLIDAIDSLKLPAFTIGVGPVSVTFPGWGGFGVKELTVPKFDTGAWNLAQDTLAMVHKGEMIIPAAPASRMRDIWGGGGGASETTHHIHVDLDGRQIAEVVDRHQGTRYKLTGTSQFAPQ